MKRTILNINEITEVTGYPYGRLRTSAFFSIEFVARKGFRTVFQTINPKNGRVNAPKKSTYSHFAFCEVEPETEHIKFKGLGFSGDASINTGAAFLSEYSEALKLTPAMITDICGSMLLCIKAGLHWTHKDRLQQVLELVNPTVELLIKAIKDNAIDFALINLPVADIERIRKEGPQIEFKVVEHHFITS